MDGYIRVSDVGGRSGDSYRSPSDQRAMIEGWAVAHGVEIGEWIVEEDVSGNLGPEKRGLGDLVERIERGDSSGIVCWRLSRFGRNSASGHAALERMKRAGGRLVTVEDGIDTAAPGGELVFSIMLALAQEELEKITAGWERARKGAIDRGVMAAGRVACGYRKRPDGTLEPDPAVAPIIREVFRKRARGESWSKLAEYLEAEGVKPWRAEHWSVTSIQKMVKSRTYLGEIRSGEYVNTKAHTPIVSEGEWFAAQSAKRALRPRTGELAQQASLAGIVRCAACGHVMQIGRQWSSGKASKKATYYCRGSSGKGKCSAPATISVAKLDEYVELKILEAFDGEGPIAEAVAASAKIEQAQRDVSDAETALAYYTTNVRLVVTLGEDRYEEAVENAVRALGLAKATLAETESSAEIMTSIIGGGLMLEAWPELDKLQRRRLLTAMLDEVRVRRSKTRGEDFTKRAQVIWKGGIDYDAGSRIEPREEALTR